MNRDQIVEKWMALSPRERDAWVAKDVLGWDVHSEYGLRFYPDNDVEASYILNEPPEDCPKELRACTGQIVCLRVPEFTADITAAWMVVEKSAEWGGMEIGYYATRSDRWVVVKTYLSKEIEVMQFTAPEAICLAAIITKLTGGMPV